MQRDEKPTCSTPNIWKNSSRTELVITGKNVCLYDPGTGKLFWEFKASRDMAVPSVVGNEEMLFIGNAGGRDVKAELVATKARLNGKISQTGTAWKSLDRELGNPSPLLYNSLIYAIGSRGDISVIDAATWTLKYQKKIPGVAGVWASPWAANGFTCSFG